MGRTITPIVETWNPHQIRSLNARSTNIDSLIKPEKKRSWYIRLLSIFFTFKEPEYQLPVKKNEPVEYWGVNERQFLSVDTSTNSRQYM